MQICLCWETITSYKPPSAYCGACKFLCNYRWLYWKIKPERFQCKNKVPYSLETWAVICLCQACWKFTGMRAGTVIQVLKTRPPLFKCAIIMDFKRTSGAKYGLICFHLGQNILSSASIWGKTFYDLLPFGAKTFMICIHLGRVFFLPKAFLIGFASIWGELFYAEGFFDRGFPCFFNNIKKF